MRAQEIQRRAFDIIAQSAPRMRASGRAHSWWCLVFPLARPRSQGTHTHSHSPPNSSPLAWRSSCLASLIPHSTPLHCGGASASVQLARHHQLQSARNEGAPGTKVQASPLPRHLPPAFVLPCWPSFPLPAMRPPRMPNQRDPSHSSSPPPFCPFAPLLDPLPLRVLRPLPHASSRPPCPTRAPRAPLE